MKVLYICIFLIAAVGVSVTLTPEENCNVCLYEFGQLLDYDKLHWLTTLVIPVICSFASVLGQKCNDFLNKYVDLALNMTIKLGPEGCCERLHACNKTSAAEMLMSSHPLMQLQRRTRHKRSVQMNKMMEDPTPASCNVCTYEFGQILNSDKLQWVANLVVPLACSITGPMAPKCVTFLDNYINEFINMTIELGPYGICEKLDACPVTTAAPDEPTPAAKAFNVLAVEEGTTYSPNCDGCKMGVAYLKAFLSSPDAVTAFTPIIDHGLCDKMPEVLVEMCDAMMKNVLPSLTQALGNLLDQNEMTLCKKACA